MTLFLSNWKTSIPGILAALCASDSVLFHIMPPDWSVKAGAACTFLLAVGLIAAKDADKSNAPRPESSPVKVLPVALLAVLIGLSACSTQGRQALSTLAVVGCALNETDVVELTAQDVLATLPPGSTIEEAQRKLAAADAAGDAACVLVDAVRAAKAQRAAQP